MMAVENAANLAAKDISFLPMKSMNVSANYRKPLSSLLSDIEHFITHCRSQRRPLRTLSPSARTVNVADPNSFRLLRLTKRGDDDVTEEVAAEAIDHQLARSGANVGIIAHRSGPTSRARKNPSAGRVGRWP